MKKNGSYSFLFFMYVVRSSDHIITIHPAATKTGPAPDSPVYSMSLFQRTCLIQQLYSPSTQDLLKNIRLVCVAAALVSDYTVS